MPDAIRFLLLGAAGSGTLVLILSHDIFCREKRYFLVAQTVKNLPAMQETQVRSLGWGAPLEKEMSTQSSILTWRIP